MILKYKDCIIFDLEATCDDKETNPDFDNECIEIGAVKIIDGKIVEKFCSFIKPQFSKVTNFCTSLTSISDTDVKDARLFPEVLCDFQNFVGDLPLLSWGFYDRKQFEKDCKRYDLSIDWLECHRSLKHEYGDLMKLDMELRISNGENVPSTYRRKVKRGWGVLSALSKEGLSFEGTHHRGIDDAVNIAHIYLSITNK